MPSTKEKGDEGEELAMQHLKGLGMKIIEMNYRYGHGEIDIIAMDGETMVFCEVKSRKSDTYGDPEYAVTLKKQQQIRRVAKAYLYDHEIKEQLCRFDVVAIRLYTRTPEINHIKNAF